MRKPVSKIILVVLFLGTTFMFSCNRNSGSDEIDLDKLITQMSENLTMINSENGKLSYRFETPLLERYELASVPYTEYRKGIMVQTYNDSTMQVESELVADYAKYMEPEKLWEARGNVVAKNKNGQILETEQLFWNEQTDKIYSNVKSTVIQGNDRIVGTGFESDSDFEYFTFRSPKGYVELNIDNEKEDISDSLDYDDLEVIPLVDSAHLSEVKENLIIDSINME